MTDPVPVTLIGGYLGAGKTTLVNHLLRNAGGRRLAVLVNEFGSLPIDADLIVAREDNLISISGGCICCSFGSDLVAALIDLKKRGNAIDHLLIETSGVALPGSIVQSLSLLPDLVLDGVIVLADAETIEARSRDRYMSDTVLGQLADADIILLNKIDLVSQQRADAISSWLTVTAPGARVLSVRNANLPLDVIIGQHSERQVGSGSTSPSEHRTEDYKTLSLEIDSPCDAERPGRPKPGSVARQGIFARAGRQACHRPCRRPPRTGRAGPRLDRRSRPPCVHRPQGGDQPRRNPGRDRCALVTDLGSGAAGQHLDQPVEIFVAVIE
jgi:G3E family GTPase